MTQFIVTISYPYILINLTLITIFLCNLWIHCQWKILFDKSAQSESGQRIICKWFIRIITTTKKKKCHLSKSMTKIMKMKSPIGYTDIDIHAAQKKTNINVKKGIGGKELKNILTRISTVSNAFDAIASHKQISWMIIAKYRSTQMKRI